MSEFFTGSIMLLPFAKERYEIEVDRLKTSVIDQEHPPSQEQFAGLELYLDHLFDTLCAEVAKHKLIGARVRVVFRSLNDPHDGGKWHTLVWYLYHDNGNLDLTATQSVSMTRLKLMHEYQELEGLRYEVATAVERVVKALREMPA